MRFSPNSMLVDLLEAKTVQAKAKLGWTQERVDLLKTLWAQGLSASQIAAQLGGISRNSVIGKVHRLGLPGRTTFPERSATAKRQARSERYFRLEKPRGRSGMRQDGEGLPGQPPTETLARTPSPEPVEASMETRPETACSILDLAAGKCRWPLWGEEDQERLYCGGRTIEGLPYCGFHGRMAYRPAETKRPRREWAA